MAGTVKGWQPKGDTNNVDEVIRVKAELYWAQLDSKNEMSEKYQVDLSNLSEAAVAKLTEAGVEVKNKGDAEDGRGHYVTAKSTSPIFAYDAEKNRIHEKIGNGSKADVVLTTYDWEFKGKKGTSASIRLLTITDLIVFENENAIDFDALPEAI